jgi:hypothetical protein
MKTPLIVTDQLPSPTADNFEKNMNLLFNTFQDTVANELPHLEPFEYTPSAYSALHTNHSAMLLDTGNEFKNPHVDYIVGSFLNGLHVPLPTANSMIDNSLIINYDTFEMPNINQPYIPPPSSGLDEAILQYGTLLL